MPGIESSAWIKRDKLMDTTGLARRARALRAEAGLTQEQVAEQIISDRTGKPISKQMISRAENDDVGTEVNALRLQIIELLSGKKLYGPVWFFPEELPPDA